MDDYDYGFDLASAAIYFGNETESKPEDDQSQDQSSGDQRKADYR